MSGRPREVFLASCDEIASAFASDSFVYARSRQQMTLWLHGTVHSRKLLRWRKAQPNRSTAIDMVAGGQIGNLTEPATWLAWNLAPEPTRLETVRDALAAIRRLALPYFDLFNSARDVVERLQTRSIPAMWPFQSIEYVLCFGSRAQAERALQRYLREQPNITNTYLERLDEYRKTGLPRLVSGEVASELARATVMYDLEPSGGVGPIAVG